MMHVRPLVLVVVGGAAVLVAAFRSFVPGREPHPVAGVDLGETAAATSTVSAPLAAIAVRARRPTGAPGDAVVVYVAGAVARPGVYRLAPSSRANDAVRAAGGVTAAADPIGVNLAGHIEDGEELVVPRRGETAAADAPTAADASSVGDPPRHHRKKRRHRKRRAPLDENRAIGALSDGSGGEASASNVDRTVDGGAATGTASASESASRPVRLNAAGAEELATLPGIGPALADRIVAFRAVDGPFASVDDLLDVAGMTKAKVDALAPFVVLP